MFSWPLVAPFDEGADGGGRGVEDVDLVALDDGPETVGLGMVGSAFVHEGGGAVLQRAVDDVAVAGDPSDVGGTPVGVFFFQIEDPFGGYVGADGIAAGGVDYAFGFAGGAGGVQDIERMLGIQGLGGADVGSFGHQIVPPVITAGLQVDGSPGALVDDYMLHGWTGLEGFFDCGEKLDFGAAAVRAVLGDYGCG